jgi:hypothetical protein
MDIRLENIHNEASPANYVSFLSRPHRSNTKGADHDSIHSVSSIRSVMSTMSSFWSRFSLSRGEHKGEKHKAALKEDIKYLYSAFTKVPCLRLSPDYKAPLIAGFEEFPFDSAVPLLAFKNVTSLEIIDVDFRQFYGWDSLADQLRSLTVKRGHVEDPSDLLVSIVLDDADRRRKRSAKTPTTPAIPWAAPSPTLKQGESGNSPPEGSPVVRPFSMGSLGNMSAPKHHSRQRSVSPVRPGSSRYGSSGHSRSGTPNLRRSSTSSGSTDRANTPRGSSSNLLSSGFVPTSKWRFLRHLCLSDNSLTSLNALSFYPVNATLQVLDLSHNLFKEIPDSLASLVSLRALNLSNCMIDSLHSLGKSPLPAITTLNLRGNRLSSIAGIERLLSLERIDLRENKLTDPTEIARLTGIPNMTEVYVNRNPFTKTHANYRVVIFNLFRSTPGYTMDVAVDGTLPSYSERKLLADRAPELPNVPIVKPVVPADVPQVDKTLPEVPALYDPFYERMQPRGHIRKKSDYTQSSRRKKTVKRRVVPIVQTEDPSEILEDSNAQQPLTVDTKTEVVEAKILTPYPLETPLEDHAPLSMESSLEAPASALAVGPILQESIPDEPIPSPSASLPPLPLPPSLPSLPSLQSIHSLPPSLPPPKLATDPEVYKQRIEAIRKDLGSAWLSALADEPWDQHGQTSPGMAFDSPFPTASPLTPPAMPVRTASQSIVSTGRTLG